MTFVCIFSWKYLSKEAGQVSLKMPMSVFLGCTLCTCVLGVFGVFRSFGGFGVFGLLSFSWKCLKLVRSGVACHRHECHVSLILNPFTENQVFLEICQSWQSWQMTFFDCLKLTIKVGRKAERHSLVSTQLWNCKFYEKRIISVTCCLYNMCTCSSDT